MDLDGIPTKETLVKLNLATWREDLTRGVLTGMKLLPLTMQEPRKIRTKRRSAIVDTNEKKTRIVKEIKVDTKVCRLQMRKRFQLLHATPKYSSVNTARP